MKKVLLGIFIAVAFLALSGCTGNNVVYDCSKCDVNCSECDTDCSGCDVDCSKCTNVNIVPIDIKSGMTFIVPSSCTDELCGISETQGWAGELGLELPVYKADWAQSPIILMYTEDSAGIIMQTSKREFMKGVCDFVNSTDACRIADEELEKAQAGMKSCLGNYSISLDTVAFYYSDTCPHCARMKPWVTELEGQGYKFFWVNYQNQTNMQIATDCLSTILQFGGGVPQFACPANGEWHIGAFAEEDELLKFASDCVAAAGD
ncbi:MAG: hypothetical protein ABIG39_01655 [Candidatus Micrarchaeota archaeon]